MKTISKIIVSVFIFLLVIYFLYQNESEKPVVFDDSIDAEIQYLIQTALDIQYKGIIVDFSDIFTEEYIHTINKAEVDSMKKYAPYIIVDGERSNIELDDKGNILSVSIHLEDKNGRYYQVFFFMKVDGKYFINTIEKDI